MAEIASAYVSLIPSAKGFGSKMDSQLGGEVQSSGKRLGGSFGKMFAVAGGALAAVGVGSFLKGAITGAGELEQSVGALDTIFGKSAEKMHGWSRDAAQSVGLTRNEFNELGTLIGSQLKNGGTAMDQLAPKTRELVTAGADLSAMFGGSTKDAVAALSSALKGERDPIERYGVSLNQAKIDAEAAALGFEKVGGALSDEAKQAATLSLISKQTADAHGTFAKESNTLAGQQQRLSASWGNMKTQLGTALLPAITSIVTALNSGLGPAIKSIKSGFATAASFLAPFVAQVQGFFGGGAGGGIMASIQSFGATIQTNLLPVLQTMANTFTTRIVPAATSLVTYVATSLVPVFSQVWSIISTRVLPIISSLAQFFYGTLYPALIDIYTTVAQKFKPVFDQLVATIQAKVLPAADDMLKKFQEWQPTIQKVISLVVKVAGKWLEFQAEIVAKVLPVIIRLAGFFISKIVPAVADVIGIVIKIIAKMIEFGGALTDAVQKAGQFLSGVKDKFGQAMTFIGGIPEKIKGVFKAAGTLLSNIGGQMVDGLKAGIEGAWHKVTDVVDSLIGKIPKKIREIMGIASPSKVTTEIGSQIAEGLAKGIDGGAKKAAEAARKVAQGVIDATKSTLSEYRDLAASIGGAFAKDVFGAVGSEAELDADGNVIKPAVSAVQQFLADTTANVAEMDAAKKAIEAMKAAGVNKTFLESLAASGNAELTIGLAADPMALAQAQSLFSQQQQLSKDIGASVASEAMRGELKGVREDLGKIDGKLEKQAERLVKSLDSLPREVSSALTKSLNEIARRG
jgi:hypothetical protein